MSMSGHQSPKAKIVSWLTPPAWIKSLGPFDTDPCCPPAMPWPTATTMYSEKDDGLKQPWLGRVWLNPPFAAKEWPKWVERLADHGNGIALIPARTETREFVRLVWGRADAVCFVRGRPHFHRACGTRAPFNSGAPIVLIAYDGAPGLRETNSHRLVRAGLGTCTLLWEGRESA